MENHILVQDSKISNKEITMELESDSIQSTLLARRSLVGKILSQKLLNRGAVKSILAKAWENYDPSKAPQYIMGHLLSLQFWVPEAAIYEVNFDKVSFWIQIHGLPLDVMNANNAAKIIKNFGEVLEVENPEAEGRLLRTFIRVRALVNIKKPLVTGYWIPMKTLPKAWILFRKKDSENWQKGQTSEMSQAAKTPPGHQQNPEGQNQEGSHLSQPTDNNIGPTNKNNTVAQSSSMVEVARDKVMMTKIRLLPQHRLLYMKRRRPN
ncbi:hypothetical protein SESBI_03332 [Sesbania bispinosa]|nr:hypothetical protein SESBI_03332 [Sesbania bispinosa]